MSPESSRQSLAEKLRSIDTPAEYDNAKYFSEVLQLDYGLTDRSFEQKMIEEAKILGIETTMSESNPEDLHLTSQDSKTSVALTPSRTLSTSSLQSKSTDITEPPSNQPSHNSTEPIEIKENNCRVSVASAKSGNSMEVKDRHEVRVGFLSAMPTYFSTSLIPVSTRKSSYRIKKMLRIRLFRSRRNQTSIDLTQSCVRCREVFKSNTARLTLSCNHSLCDSCTQYLVLQSCNDDDIELPQRFRKTDVTGSVIETILSNDERTNFLKSILRLSSPADLRKLCPLPACRYQTPNLKPMNIRRSLEFNLHNQEERVHRSSSKIKNSTDQKIKSNSQPARESRRFSDYGNEAVTSNTRLTSRSSFRQSKQRKIYGKQGEACSQIDHDRDEILEERDDRVTADEIEAAQKRTMENCELSALHARQINERDRFRAFERKMKWFMLSRHRQQRAQILEKYEERFKKMKECHTKCAIRLEDSQVLAEMDLRSTLRQAEQGVRTRLRHMEAYCSSIGPGSSENVSSRVVTERDLKELGQQYNIQDNITQLHQSKINILREKQAKQMEHLLAQQEHELTKLNAKRHEEVNAAEKQFVIEMQGLVELFAVRRANLQRKLALEEKIERKKLEQKENTKFAPLLIIEWPEQDSDTESESELQGAKQELEAISE